MSYRAALCPKQQALSNARAPDLRVLRARRRTKAARRHAALFPGGAQIQRAKDAGVEKIFLPNIDIESISSLHDLCDRFPTLCYPMMGLHPCHVKENFRDVLSIIHQKFSERKYIAVGEIGIDLYWDKTTLPIQIEAFKTQINWAKEFKLPIVIHARESFDEIFSVVDEMNDEHLRGVFHCFTGTIEQARHIMEYKGFMMGIGGVLTYKNGGLDKIVIDIPIEHLVLETSRANEFQPGDELLAIPRHVCPTCALHRAIFVIAGGDLVDQWEVASRDRWLTI